jgi:hypothetical protein
LEKGPKNVVQAIDNSLDMVYDKVRCPEVAWKLPAVRAAGGRRHVSEDPNPAAGFLVLGTRPAGLIDGDAKMATFNPYP